MKSNRGLIEHIKNNHLEKTAFTELTEVKISKPLEIKIKEIGFSMYLERVSKNNIHVYKFKKLKKKNGTN